MGDGSSIQSQRSTGPESGTAEDSERADYVSQKST